MSPVNDKKKKSPKRGRRLIVVLLIVVLLLGWAVYEVFLSTNATIRRAEAFLFRRMTVVQLEEGHYRYFFVSNRDIEAGDDPVEDRVTTERSEDLAFGSYDIRLSPLLGLGGLLHWSDFLQTEQIRVTEARLHQQDDFVGLLRSYVDASPGRSLLIMVHGFGETFSLGLRRTAFFASVLDVNAPVLVFDWPADQGGLLGGYHTSRRLATESAEEFARAIELIIREIDPDNLAILGNSMGAQVVVDGFALLHENPEIADLDTEFSQVVLTAPDVSRRQFNQRFKREITHIADHLTVYVSSNDRALIVSRLLNREARAGESTIGPDQFSEAVELAQLIERDSDQITLVDVTPVNRTRNFHNFYVESPEFFDDLFMRLTTDKAPQSRRIHRVVAPDERVYWVLTSGR
jgi:esterase/lipase superfamily enzyme